MADNNRTVQLDVAVSTSGSEGIRALATDVTELAKSGGEAAPQFTKLAAELNKIASQADAIQALSKLGDEVRLLGVAETEAKDKSALLAAELSALSAATRAAAEAEASAQTVLRGAKADLDSKREALARLRIETDAADKDTETYTEAVKALRLAILDARNDERVAAEARRAAAEATKVAEAAENALQATYRASARDVQAANEALAKRKAILDTDRAALEADGVATENLAAAQTTLLQAYSRVSEGVQTLVATQTAAAVAREKEIASTQKLVEAQKLLDAEIEISNASIRDSIAAENARVQAFAAGEARIAQQAKAAGDALQQAFSATGVRSIAAINEEINQIGSSLVRLQNNTSVTGAEFDRAFTAAQVRIAALKQEINGVPAALEKGVASAKGLTASFADLVGAFAAFEFIGKPFLDANIQMENLRRTLVLVTGSTQTAAEQIDFLKRTANESGVAVGSIAGAYSRFVASATSSGIALDVVNRAFSAVTKSSGLLGLSSEDTSAALNALGQSASKGKVSLEELQQQLGDRLPAVLATTAKGLGITTAQLTKLVETGKLAADNTYFIAFASGIEQTFLKTGESVEGLQAQIGRFKNATNEAFVSLGQSGVVDVLTNALKTLAPAVAEATKFIIGLGKSMGEASGFVVDFGTKVLKLDFKGASASVKTLREDVDELNQKWFGAPTRAQQTEAIKLMRDLGISYQDAVEKVKANVAAQAAQSAALANTTTSATTAASAQKALAASVDLATEAVAKGTGNSAQIAVVYDNLITKSKARVKALEEEVLAAKSTGEASVRLAEIAGNEITTLQAQTVAAENNAKALEALASEKRTEATLSVIEVNALERAAEASGTLTEARKKELETMRLKADALSAEAHKSEEAAALAEAEAVKRRLLAETYGDQSTQLGKLREAYEAAKVKVAEVVEAEKNHAATTDDVRKATLALTEAEARYHDALKDVVEMLKAKNELDKANRDLAVAALDVQKAQIQAEIDVAKARGDEFTVTQKQVELKQVEIKIIEAKVNAQKAEAVASIAVAEAERAELEAEGKLTPAKALAIEATIKAAEAKKLEADAIAAGTKVLQQQIDNLNAYGKENITASKSADTLKSSVDGVGDSLKKSGDGAVEATAKVKTYGEALAQVAKTAGDASASLTAWNKQNFSVLGSNTYDKDGFATDSSGARIVSNTQANVPQGGSFDKGAFDRDSLNAVRLGQTPPDPNNPRYLIGPSATSGTPTYLNPNFASDLAAFQARVGQIGNAAGSSPFASAGGITPDPTPTKSAPSSVTTNIHLDGAVTTIGVNSQSDVDKLAGILGTLTSSKARTSA